MVTKAFSALIHECMRALPCGHVSFKSSALLCQTCTRLLCEPTSSGLVGSFADEANWGPYYCGTDQLFRNLIHSRRYVECPAQDAAARSKRTLRRYVSLHHQFALQAVAVTCDQRRTSILGAPKISKDAGRRFSTRLSSPGSGTESP